MMEKTSIPADKRPQQGYVLILIVVVLGIAIVAGLWILRPKAAVRPKAQAKPPSVEVMQAMPQVYQAHVNTQGTVAPRREINLVSQVSGRAVTVADNFVEGGFFKAQQTLIQLDGRDYEYELLNAESKVANAKRELALERGQARQAKREWRDLGSKEANALFLRQPQVQAAEAALVAAEAARQQAELNVSRTRIGAPFAGRVMSTQVDLGQFVPAGSVVGRVYDSGAVEVRLPLSNEQLALSGISLQDLSRQNSFEGLGSSARKSSSTELMLSATLGAETHQWPARLTGMDASIEQSTRFLYLTAEVTDPFNTELHAQPLMVGLFVEARLPGRRFEQALRLPEIAVVNNLVFIVDSDQQLLQKAVTPIAQEGNDLWVHAPEIDAGELIVVSDPRVLRTGLTVTVNSPQKSTE